MASSKGSDSSRTTSGTKTFLVPAGLALVSLLIGSGLTFVSTTLTNDIDNEKQRASEKESFFREQRVTAYTEFVNALLESQTAAMNAVAALDSAADQRAVQIATARSKLFETSQPLQLAAARILIVGSEPVAEAATAANTRVVFAIAEVGAKVAAHADHTEEERDKVRADLGQTIGCLIIDSNTTFSGISSFDLGATTTPFEPLSPCENRSMTSPTFD